MPQPENPSDKIRFLPMSLSAGNKETLDYMANQEERALVKEPEGRKFLRY